MRFVLGLNLDRRAVLHQIPDFFDLDIGNRDAAVGPIPGAMGCTNKSLAVGQAVDEDVSSRRDAQFAGAFAVGCVRIRDVQRAMKLAVRISAVNYVDALRCFVITLLDFWANRISAEGDLVGLDCMAGVNELHGARAFVDEDSVGVGNGVKT